MSPKILLTFLDNSVREYETGVTGRDISQAVSSSLAKKALAYVLNGKLHDLMDPILISGTIEILTKEDPRSLELIRHSCAHILAQAVQELFPGTQVTIGPTIENGFYYDFSREKPFSIEDLKPIEKKMREIIQKNQPFRKEIWSREHAKEVFSSKGEAYKVELIDAIPDDQNVTIYINNHWFDLCRGPHVFSTGQVGTAFRLMKVAGAYWRGDSKNPMLTRIYGTAFAKESDLKSYLYQLEEAEKRDHRKLGREMSLFHFQEEGPGVVFWHPNGWQMFQCLLSYMRRRLISEGYCEVNAPQVLDKSLWETSGHWEWYRENMFQTVPAGDNANDLRSYVLKPMNCPGHLEIFKYGLKSYRDLPIKLSEFGIVHRYEPSGSLHGLMRVRGFTQDDAHVFCTEEQMADECLKINNLILSTYADFGFHDVKIKLSTRPEKRVGSDASWEYAERIMTQVLERIALESNGHVKTEVVPGDGAFYGPKLEYTLKDAIGREWQCGTTQVDFNLPERFEAFYINRNSEKCEPVMIHRAICGSLERFLGILIEHYAGIMPLWLAPIQVVVATITGEADTYAQKIISELRDLGIRAHYDNRNEKIGYKIREHSVQKIPLLFICGKKEEENETVNVRRFGSFEQKEWPLSRILNIVKDESTPPDQKRHPLL